LRGSPSGR